MKDILIIVSAGITVVILALLCGYLSGCTRSISDEAPLKPSNN